MENLITKSKVSEVELIYKAKAPISDKIKVITSADSYRVFYSIYDINKIEHKEFFYAMLLNNANRVLAVIMISEGGCSGTVCDPKNVFQSALLANATAIVLCHNHPSGNTQPSNEDRKLTDKLVQGARLLDMRVIDHLIITAEENQYLSFADEGYI